MNIEQTNDEIQDLMVVMVKRFTLCDGGRDGTVQGLPAFTDGAEVVY
ncbi:MAG: hypothetical protein Q7T78_11150 [Rhodoferax sp.]|nr:hypothetical protein [Rhodoferax sp.]